MRKLVENRLVLASHNKGKLVEIAELLKPFGKSVVSAGDLGFAEPAETEDSFEGNARIKAHFAAKSSGLPALSDDSGLQVFALDNAPGVYYDKITFMMNSKKCGAAFYRIEPVKVFPVYV